jgi:HrpA-like RNA helicase
MQPALLDAIISEKITFRVVDDKNKKLQEGRSLQALKEALKGKVQETLSAARLRGRWSRRSSYAARAPGNRATAAQAASPGQEGLRRELIIALIKSLPKPVRRNFVPAPNYAEAFLRGRWSRRSSYAARAPGNRATAAQAASPGQETLPHSGLNGRSPACVAS